MYETGNIVDSMYESVYVALYNVDGSLEYNKRRTLSIMDHITKILLRIILKRIRSKIRPNISDEQIGFVSDKGTSNALFSLRVLTEKALELQKYVSTCFVYFEKSFGKVRHVELFKMLKEAGMDGRDRNMMRDL